MLRLNLEAEIADIETHYIQGKKLLDQSFPKEALVQFEYCLKHDVMSPRPGNAWPPPMNN